jgi:hypothetical protein
MSKIQHRRGTTAEWVAADPILAPGEIGIDLTTAQAKVGNGNDSWTELPYLSGSGGATTSGAIVVRYDSGWPNRPTDSADVTVLWVGGTPSTPPTDVISGVDLWYVPNL